MLLEGDRLYKLYIDYTNDNTIELSKEEKIFFDRYNKKKGQGFTFMEYNEFECLIKYNK